MFTCVLLFIGFYLSFLYTYQYLFHTKCFFSLFTYMQPFSHHCFLTKMCWCTHTNTHVYFWTHVFCGLKNVLFLLSCFFFGMLTHKDRNKYKRTRYSDCLQCQDLVTDIFSSLLLCSGFPPTVPNMAKAWFILFSNDVLLKVNKSRHYNCEMLLLPK